jgi:hypothetical protein
MWTFTPKHFTRAVRPSFTATLIFVVELAALGHFLEVGVEVGAGEFMVFEVAHATHVAPFAMPGMRGQAADGGRAQRAGQRQAEIIAAQSGGEERLLRRAGARRMAADVRRRRPSAGCRRRDRRRGGARAAAARVPRRRPSGVDECLLLVSKIHCHSSVVLVEGTFTMPRSY